MKKISSMKYVIYASVFWCIALIIDFLVIRVSFSNASIFGNALVSGALLNTPYTEFYLKDYWLYGSVSTFLYQHYPHVAWLPVIFILLTVLSLLWPTALLIERWVQSPLKIRRTQFPVMLGAFFALNLSIVTLEHNRVAFILMASGLLIPILKHGIPVGWKEVLYVVVVTLLSTFLRVEATIGTILVIGPILFYTYRFKIKELFKWMALPMLLVLVYAISLIVALEKSPLYYYQIEPDFEYELMDKNNIIPLSDMKTIEDSIRYEAIGRYWFLGDSVQIPPSFIRNLIQKNDATLSRYLPSLQGNAFKSFNSKLHSLFKQPIVWLFMAVILVAQLAYRFHKNFKWLILWAIYILFLLLFVVGSINQEIEPRITEPILGCALVALLPLLFCQTICTNKIVHILNGFVLVSSLGNQWIAYQRNVVMQQTGELNQAFLKKVNNHPAEYVAMLTYGNLFNFAPSAFATHKMLPSKKVLPLHLAQYSHSASLKSYISNLTGCNDNRFECILNFLIANKHRVVIVSSPASLEFLQRYAKLLYQVSFTYSVVSPDLRIGEEHVFKID